MSTTGLIIRNIRFGDFPGRTFDGASKQVCFPQGKRVIIYGYCTESNEKYYIAKADDQYFQVAAEFISAYEAPLNLNDWGCGLPIVKGTPTLEGQDINYSPYENMDMGVMTSESRGLLLGVDRGRLVVDGRSVNVYTRHIFFPHYNVVRSLSSTYHRVIRKDRRAGEAHRLNFIQHLLQLKPDGTWTDEQKREAGLPLLTSEEANQLCRDIE